MRFHISSTEQKEGFFFKYRPNISLIAHFSFQQFAIYLINGPCTIIRVNKAAQSLQLTVARVYKPLSIMGTTCAQGATLERVKLNCSTKIKAVFYWRIGELMCLTATQR